MSEIFDDLLNYIKTLKVIDTHEHLPCWEKDRIMDNDVIQEFLGHYFNRDLFSSGLPKKDYDLVIKGKMSVLDRWRIIEPYWKNSMHTGYGRSLIIIAKELYGIENIDLSSIEELNNRFLKTLKPGYFKKILKEKCNIETSLLCVDVIDTDYDPGKERMAQSNVAKALTIKVENGSFEIEEAKRIAKMLFYDNPKNIFKI